MSRLAAALLRLRINLANPNISPSTRKLYESKLRTTATMLIGLGT